MMGMSPTEMEDITLRQFICKWRGFLEGIQQAEREAWMRTRWQTFHLVPNKRRNARIIDLGIFPWEMHEKGEGSKIQQQQRAKKLAEKWHGGSKPQAKMMI